MKNQKKMQQKNEAADEPASYVSKYNKGYYEKNKKEILAKMDKPKDVVARLTQILVEKERIPLTRIRLHFKEAGLK